MSRDLEEQYRRKDADYYGKVRSEIVAMLPARAPRALDVGCGSGATLAHLKREGIVTWAAGVEYFPAAAERARAVADVLYEGSIEEIALDIAPASLDLVLCLDVLEHLIDPWAVARRLAALLRPGGIFVASVPNVRHFRVVGPLLVRGEWRYTESGLLDRTHLRFFTRRSLHELVEQAGLTIDMTGRTGLGWSAAKRALDVLTFGRLRDLLAFQHLVRARRAV